MRSGRSGGGDGSTIAANVEALRPRQCPIARYGKNPMRFSRMDDRLGGRCDG
jgi:hypothetical protein